MSAVCRSLRPLARPAGARHAFKFNYHYCSENYSHQAQAAQICRHPCRRFLATAPAAADAGNLPLSGIRVLDMTRVLAGPYSTQILGDLGAEVIKIEHPQRGDDTRAWGPPFASYTAESGAEGPGEAAYFLSHEAGVNILHDLAKTCDVLVENYLPGGLKKYSMDYETLSKVNPALIYASITGYGMTGPYSNRPGYDVMVEAEFGLMHITGEREGPPVKVGVAITDITTGLYASNSIMAALLGRGRTGRGQHLDIALSDCQTAALSNIASSVLVTGARDSGRWGTAHPSIVPYRGFPTRDGDFFVGSANDKLFGILCDKIGHPEWKTDARFTTNGSRVANRDELERMLSDVFQTKSTQAWLDIFEGAGMPYAKVNDVKATLEHEHTVARNMVKEVHHPACGPMKLLNHPVKYSDADPGVRMPPPTLGQHTNEILGSVLGMSAGEIDALRKQGIVT